MAKRKTARQKIAKREAAKQSEKDVEIASSFGEDREPGSLRLKQKFTKRMQFLSKLQETQSFLGTKKIISKKKHRRKKSALNNLSSLAEVLPSFEETNPKQSLLPKRKQGKARQHLMIREVKQLSKVLDHPQFKENPFTAIHAHLVNTLGPVVQDQVRPIKKKGATKKTKRKDKGNIMDMEQ